MRARTVTQRSMWKLSAWLIQCHAALFLPPHRRLQLLCSCAQHSKYSTYSGNIQPSSPTLYFWFQFFGILSWIIRPKGQIECLTFPMVCSRPHLLPTTYWRCEGLAKTVPCSLAPQTPWIATNVCLLHVSWKHHYHWKRRSRRNDISLKNWWNNSFIVTHWWNLSIDCLRLPYRPS